MALLTALGAIDAPTAFADNTHLSQDLAQHVTLIAKPASWHDVSADCRVTLHRVQTNGKVSSNPFVIPDGFALVVTDVDWGYLDDFNKVDTSPYSLKFEITVNGTPVFVSSVVQMPPKRNAVYLGKTEHLTSGILAGKGATLCPRARFYQLTTSGNVQPTDVVLRGYLLREWNVAIQIDPSVLDRITKGDK